MKTCFKRYDVTHRRCLAARGACDWRVLLVLFLVLTLTRCASAPPPAPIPVIVSYEQKLAWILRLEDQRLLRDPALPEPEDTPSVEGEDPEAPPAPRGAAAPGALRLPQSATPGAAGARGHPVGRG